ILGADRPRVHQRLERQRPADRRPHRRQAWRRDRARHAGDVVRARVTWRLGMLEPVSVGLKFAFLAILYLFLLWVAWSAVRDLRRGRQGTVSPERIRPSDATG